jgi:O-antigen/teichoic acid export membrane protein
MAMVVTSFFIIFADPALAAALVQRPTIDERDRSTVFWLALAIGVALTVLGVASAGLVADFFGEHEVKALFTVTSLCFVVASLSVVHRALLLRRLAYRTLEIREMVAIATGGAVAVALAAAGFGPWSIVSNFVAYTVVSTVLLWVLLDWRPRLHFSFARARTLIGFSARLLSAQLLSWGNANLDKALVGRVLGAAALGAYSLAAAAALIPLTLLGAPLHQVVSPAYSRIQDDPERLQRAWLRSKQMSVAVVAPALLTLAVAAPDFVTVVLGAKWDEAVVPLQLLCIGGVANALMALNWSLLQSTGAAKTLLRVMLLSSVVTWTGFALGVLWGIVGVAALYAAARWLLVVPASALTTRAVNFDLGAALRAGAAMLPLALVAAGVGLGVRLLLLETGAPAGVRLVAVGGAIMLAYGVLVVLAAPAMVRELVQIVRPRRAGVSLPRMPA